MNPEFHSLVKNSQIDKWKQMEVQYENCRKRYTKEVALTGRLEAALEKLVHLHDCELEGISSGMPTSEQWMNAVDEARRVLTAERE